MKSGVAVTQVCLSRNNIILIARLSAATRLYPGGYLSRIAILRALLRETLEAAISPDSVVSSNALIAGLRSHFERVRVTPGHRLAQLAMNLRQGTQTQSPFRSLRPTLCDAAWLGATGSPPPCEPTTLRLPTAEIVAIDNYRCDIRQASGVCISRSTILRVTIESFARAFQV